MAAIRKTPIMLITGSLGSGKTTLLRRILDFAPFRIAVLMNEFGELAIDSRVIEGKNVDIIELAGGCVCCSMTGEFEAAVREIIEVIGPDFIVVEATGVAESDALVFEVEDNLPEVRLDSVVCIVDAYLGVRHPHVGYVSRTHIESAEIILINKADLVTPAEAETVETQVRKHNDRAAMLRTVNCCVDTNLLFVRAPESGRAGLSHLPGKVQLVYLDQPKDPGGRKIRGTHSGTSSGADSRKRLRALRGWRPPFQLRGGAGRFRGIQRRQDGTGLHRPRS